MYQRMSTLRLLAMASTFVLLSLTCLSFARGRALQGYADHTSCNSPTDWALNPRDSKIHPKFIFTATPVVAIPEATSTLTGIAATAPTVGPSNLTGKTPALGWNSWNAYRCDISEARILAAANQFVALGLKAAGYQYINIDDCWSLRDRCTVTNQIKPDPVKFPNGISYVANEVHALGLKFGIYSDAGTETCAGYPGSLGHEFIDAVTFSDWGVDYLKYDNCNVPGNWTDSTAPQNNDWYNSNSAIRYRQMTATLAAQQNPIHFSLCIWGKAEVWTWGKRVGHSWRIAGDSSPTWGYLTSILSDAVQHKDYTGFFGHNDMDMMEIGNGDLTIYEERTHFAAWIMMRSPILLGTDLSLLDSTQLSVITNRELLAYHQDTQHGGSASPFQPNTADLEDPPQYYVGCSTIGTHIFMINTSPMDQNMAFEFCSVPGLNCSGTYLVHDMWTGDDLGTYGGSGLSGDFSVMVVSHDTVAYRITSVEN